MQRTCTSCRQKFTITDEDLAFLKEVAPTFAGKTFEIPPPTLCPECRQQRRLLWRNERVLYPRVCDATGKKFISPLSPDKPFPVYENDHWYSDKWDAREFGRPFDFSRPFFPQFIELLHVVPQLGRSCTNLQNSDYVNQCGWSKDCYLTFDADYNESCFYSNDLWQSKSCMDMLQVYKSQLCYECTDCMNCYGLRWSRRCENCSESNFLQGCIGCQSCTGCVNLRNKRYCYFNEQLSKEDYEQRVKELRLDTRAGIDTFRKQWSEWVLQFPVKYMIGAHNEESVGDGLWHTQRCVHCFDVMNSQDCRYVYQSRNMKKAWDIMNFGGEGSTEFCYECHEVGDNARSILFSDQVWTNCNDLLYCKLMVNGCHHCFGCVGLKHASYCIFNVQFEKDEYEQQVAKIIEHMQESNEWGQFMHGELSYYGYNETLAQQYYPLSKEEAIERGYHWKDDIDEKPRVSKIISALELPETIDEISDDILEWAIECDATKRPYRIVKQELDFYREQRLPIPLFHPDERHRQRMAARNPRTLWDRECMNCGKEIRTTYAPDRPEIVYCESCYLEAVA